MWKVKFRKTTHCPIFRANKLRNPITNRPIKEGGETQKWFVEACKRGARISLPKRREYGLRERIATLADLVRIRHRGGGINKLIDIIEGYNRGMFVPDLIRSFKRAFVSSKREELPEVIFKIGDRQFKISRFGPVSQRLQELSSGYKPESGIPEAPKRNVCKARNVMELPERPDFEPQIHQIRPVEFMRTPDARLLLQYGLGSGKTCASSMVVNDYLERNPGNLVYFFSPGALRSNFIKEFCSFCPEDRRKLPADEAYKRIRYFSNDDGTLKRKLPSVFTDCLVVVDEAQSLIRSVRQDDIPQTEDELKNLVVLFQRLTRGSYSNVRLLLLSGTPMPDTLTQHYNALTLLKPERMRTLSFEDFVSMFEIVEETYKPVDEPAVGELYSNCIYQFDSPQTEVPEVRYREEIVEVDQNTDLGEAVVAAVDNEETTRLIPLNSLIRSIMKRERISERKARQFAILLKTRASKRDTSRRLSNLYPVDPEPITPKLDLLLENLQDETKCPGKQIIYCPFKENSGVNLISSLLTGIGITNVVYSGDVSMRKRDSILNRYNAEGNDTGSDIKVFLYTDAAAEGISLLSVRGIHLVNEDNYSSHMNQVIGRGIRFRSHSRLPEGDRNATVFRYRLMVGETSPDKLNYEEGLRRERLLTTLSEKIREDWAMDF